MNNYVLKANNRKKASGVTLQAKIVSPDKKDYIYRQYPVQLQVQKLTDKECVIRDKQQIESILNSANNNGVTRFWTQITDEIMSLDMALNSATNGSSVTYDDEFGGKYFSPDSDGSKTIIDQTGKILNRPKYDPSRDENYFMTELRIYIYKGDEHQTYTQNILVPGYTGDEILTMIYDGLYNEKMWELVKNRNSSNAGNYYVTSSLNKPAASTIMTNLNLSEYMNIDYCPTYSVYVPQYFTNTEGIQILTFTNAGDVFTYSPPSPQEMVSAVADNPTDLSVTNLSLSPTGSDKEAFKKIVLSIIPDCPLYKDVLPLQNPTGMTIAKIMTSTRVSNAIEFTWTAEGGSDTIKTSTPDLMFVSSAITMENIRANIRSSAKYSWFIPPSALQQYTSVSGNPSLFTAGEKTLNGVIGNNKNIIIKLPKTLDQLVQNTSGDTTYDANIVDTTGIGYYKNASGVGGFTDAMIQYVVKLSTDVPAYFVSNVSVDTQPSLISTANPVTYNQLYVTNNENLNGFNYLVIKYDDISSSGLTQIDIQVGIKFPNNELGENHSDQSVTLFFK